MQTLARDGLNDAQVTALLVADTLTMTAGCELLDLTLNVVEDISDDLESGKVWRQNYANIHGACTLRLARELGWGVDLVRPYVVLTDGQVSARVNVGVYALTTPERMVGEDPVVYEVSGFDRLYLLAREVGADYTVTAGTTYRAALLAAFAAAGLTGVLIEGSAADSTLPSDRVWPLVGRSTDPDQTNSPATWLRVVNDLLNAINFRAVWADDNGLFRCAAYQDAADRPSEFTFDADSALTIVGEDRKVVADVWRTPNRWVFRQTNRPGGAPPATEGDGVYTVVNQSDGPQSIDARGLVWTKVYDYEAADQSKLVDLGDRRVALDRRSTAKLAVTTGPFPVAGHFDVFIYRDSAAGLDTKVMASAWSFDLSGSDTTWEWEVVT